MANKLGYQSSIEIVSSALREVNNDIPVAHDTLIGTVLPDSTRRELFRAKIRDRVLAAGYEINWKNLRVEPHQTVKHVALALSGLAGDPWVDDELAGDPSVDDEVTGDPKVDDE